MKKSILVLVAAAMLFASCGETTTTGNQTVSEAPTTVAEPESNEVVITISAGDDMKFDKTEIKVKEGQKVRLTLNHTGKAPLSAMGHNFVLLASGTDFDAFTKEAVNAKDNDYIPESMEKEVITHTKTVGGGETTAIDFTAPAKGTYDFLCSFPGHAVLMKGRFIVE